MTDRLNAETVPSDADTVKEDFAPVPHCCAPGRAAFLVTTPAATTEQK
jgi:hypothetical protein